MIKNPKNILLVRTDRLGDVVLSLPLAKIIKKHYPDCKLTFLVREYTKHLVEGNAFVDEVLVLKTNDGKIDRKANIDEIKKRNFDVGIVIYPTFDIAWMLFRAKVKHRIGTGYRLYSFLFNEKVYEHRKKGDKHELEYNVNLLNRLGIDEAINKRDVSFNIQIEEKSKQHIEEFFGDIQLDRTKPTIIIHPGSGGSAVDWPISHFKELNNLLAQSLNVNIIITGSESEKTICHEIMNEKTINTAGMFELPELMALIDSADILVANSTGPIHIAAALGKHVIGFYPMIKECAPRRWGPYTDKAIVFTPELDCEDCTREKCEKLNCMSTIKPEKVFRDIESIAVEIQKRKSL